MPELFQLGLQVEFNTGASALESDASKEENEEHDVREDRREVHDLKHLKQSVPYPWSILQLLHVGHMAYFS